VWNIWNYIRGQEPTVYSWHKWRPSIVYSSHINSVFKLLTVLKKYLSHVCVTYSRICEPVCRFLENMWSLLLFGCGPLCQCNMFRLYVRQLKEVFVYCYIWMGWCSLYIHVIWMWHAWQVVWVSRWSDRDNWFIVYAAVCTVSMVILNICSACCYGPLILMAIIRHNYFVFFL